MGRTLVGGKPGGAGEYNARYVNFTMEATPTLQADGQYYIVSDVPYDPAKDLIVGLIISNDRIYTCKYRYTRYRQSDWYGYTEYLFATSIDGKLACMAYPYNSADRDWSVEFKLLIYTE